MIGRFFATCTLVGVSLLIPGEAAAQYKNTAFGLDGAYWLVSKPSILNKNGSIKDLDERPIRLANGFRVGGETNLKMDEDHWWSIFRLNLAFLQYAANKDGEPNEVLYDQEAKKALGTVFGLQGQIGIRYFVLTDRFRPYLQFGLSYLRLMTFKSVAESDCTVATICGAQGGTNEANFLPHPNVGGAHFQPGVELIFTRDVAIHLYVDLQHWFIFNAADNNALVFGLGVNFYT